MKKTMLICMMLMLVLVAVACSTSNKDEVQPTSKAEATPTAEQEAGKEEEPPVSEEPIVEQTEFDVVLVDAGSNSFNVLKVVKNSGGHDLAKSKELVESAPVTIVEKVSKEKAEALKEELEEVGATVEIK